MVGNDTGKNNTNSIAASASKTKTPNKFALFVQACWLFLTLCFEFVAHFLGECIQDCVGKSWLRCEGANDCLIATVQGTEKIGIIHGYSFSLCE
jgi:hypothetical protein